MGSERVLFVHAHPGDESITTGATIATLVDAGASVTVLTCTRGEAIAAESGHLARSPDDLDQRREAELAEALAILGVTDHRILGEKDARWAGRAPRRYTGSGMPRSASGAADPDSLSSAEFGEVASDIAAVMIDVRPDVVVSHGADGDQGHPDRRRVHEAARTAAEVLRVPFYVMDDTPGPRSVQVDSDPVLDRKRAAIAAHRSRNAVEGGALSPVSAAPESFSRLRPPTASFGQSGLGARIAVCALAVVLGAFVGAMATVVHQATATVGGVVVPWGVAVAVIITAALLAGLRIVFHTRVVAGCASLGLLAASALLALQSAGGSVLVPANIAGYTWTFAPVVIALLVLAWPSVGRPASQRPGVGRPASRRPGG